MKKTFKVALVAIVSLVSIGWESTGPASAAPSEPIVHLFTRGADSSTWLRTHRQSGGWGPWIGLGGATTGTPAGGFYPDGRVGAFVRGLDGQVWTATSTGSTATAWGGWQSLGGGATSDPTVVTVPWAAGPGEPSILVFIRGLDFRLYVNVFIASSGTWTGWRGPGATYATGLSAWTDVAGRRVYVSGVQADGNAFITRVDAAGNLAGGYVLGGAVLDAPAGYGPENRQVIIARWFDRQVVALFSGSGWIGFGGALSHRPILGPFISAIGRGVDGQLYLGTTTSGWSWLGGAAANLPPSGDYVTSDAYLLAVAGVDGGAWIRWWNDSTGSWGGWTGLGGQLASEPSILAGVER